MKEMIDKILSLEEFIKKPPVLIDIGASGGTHSAWEYIKKYSICIAFDADDREISVTKTENKEYKKLIMFNRVLTTSTSNEIDFYLTESPYCSSSLAPYNEKLKPWFFENLFKVKKKIKLSSISLNESLKLSNLDYIDWFKTDSQGTDLRLFMSLDKSLRNNITVAEFEPGIIDAYKEEDKLYSILKTMDSEPFWLSELELKGTLRFKHDIAEKDFSKKELKHIIFSSKKAPCWGEMKYIHKLSTINTERGYLLGWLFSSLSHEHLFAYQLILKAQKEINFPLFEELKKYSLCEIKSVLSLKFRIKRKFFNICKKIFQ